MKCACTSDKSLQQQVPMQGLNSGTIPLLFYHLGFHVNSRNQCLSVIIPDVPVSHRANATIAEAHSLFRKSADLAGQVFYRY